MVHISKGRIATSGTGVFGKGVVTLYKGQKYRRRMPLMVTNRHDPRVKSQRVNCSVSGLWIECPFCERCQEVTFPISWSPGWMSFTQLHDLR